MRTTSNTARKLVEVNRITYFTRNVVMLVLSSYILLVLEANTSNIFSNNNIQNLFFSFHISDLSPYFVHMLTRALYHQGDISTSSSMMINNSLSLQLQACFHASMIPLLESETMTLLMPWLNLKFLATFWTNLPSSPPPPSTRISRTTFQFGLFLGKL